MVRGRNRGKMVRVKCLGPAKAEHWFMAQGKFNRICKACTKLLGAIAAPRFYTLSSLGREERE